MSIDKPHFYDGRPYEVLFDRSLKEVRGIIVGQIEADSDVIDMGCGTGVLAFDLAEKCRSVIGVELSSKMVAHACRRQQINGKQNVNFIHGDAAHLSNFEDQQFGYAIISMAIHEMPPELRTKVLNEAKRIAKKVVIADYTVPQPLNFAGMRTRIIEFLAGIDHFRGFRSFQRDNGINQLLARCGLFICSDFKNRNGTIRVVVAQQ